MGLPSTAIIEVRTTGSDTQCAGGFNPARGGTDYSQQNSAQATGTATSVSATVTATTAIFTSAMVGNYITDGTTTKEITGFTSSTIITVDSAPSWTAATIYVGGALASPGKAGQIKVQSNDVFIKAGTYTLTTSSANVASGPVSDTTGGVDSSDASWWVGYDTTRSRFNTDTNRPLIQVPVSGVSSITIFASSSLNTVINNITVDGGSRTSIIGFDISQSFGGGRIFGSKASNCTTCFQSTVQGINLFSCCEASAGGIGFTSSQGGEFYDCTAHGCTQNGFITDDCVFVKCTAYSNTGTTTDGFASLSNTASNLWINCTAWGNGRTGFYVNTSFARNYTAINCIAVNNGGYGFDSLNACDLFIVKSCGGYNNTSGNCSTNVQAKFDFVTLTGDPFTAAASGDFSLNATVGAGAALRAIGYPSTFPGGLTSDFADIGAAQHQDSGGGGGGTTVNTILPVPSGLNGGF